MPIVADASVAIRGDMTGFHQDLRGAETATKGLGGKLKEIFSPRNLAMGAGAFGIGLGVRAVVGYAGDAAKAFSDLQQTQRTTDDVFGDSASVIEDWAARAADAAGMSQQTVFTAASVMGQTLRNMGFDAEESADRVVMLQERAAEMGIAFGQTPERAILAITAAMRGERDTIEKFGVSIKQVDVNSRVAAMGLDVSTAAAKKNSDSLAILDIIMEQTAGQAGRFADGQDDVAVKLVTTQAKIDNAMVVAGEQVANIQLGAIKVVEGTVGAAESVGMFFDNVFSPEKEAQVRELAESMGVHWGDMRRIITVESEAAGRTWEAQLDFMVDEAEVARTGVSAAMTEGMRWTHQAIIDGTPPIDTAARFVADIPRKTMVEAYQALRDAAYQAQVEIAAGLIEGQNAPQVAMDAALQLVEEELTAEQEIVRLKGNLLTLETAAGIASEEGKTASVIAINGAIQVVKDRLDFIQSDFYTSGYNIGVAWANGLRGASDYANLMAWELAASADPALHGLSPPKEGPLKNIDKWGKNIGMAWAGGLLDSVGSISSAAHAMAAAAVPGSGTMAMAGSMVGGSSGGGVVKNFYLTVEGKQPVVSSAQEILHEMARLESFSG